MSPFEFDFYRAYLQEVCNHKGTSRGFRASLARAAGCQASYFSQALQGKAHLTEDHLLGISTQLSLEEAETEYLLLLLRWEKAGTEKLRSYLYSSLKRSKTQYNNLKNKVRAKEPRSNERDLGIYATSWIPSAVHLLTSEPEFQNAEAIARRLRLPVNKVLETLHFLERAGFVEKSGKNWQFKPGSLHIPKDSPWHSALQASRREMAARSIALGRQETQHFSSVFTIDAEDLKKLEGLVTKLIEGSHEVIQKSGTKRLACLCVDLFEVI